MYIGQDVLGDTGTPGMLVSFGTLKNTFVRFATLNNELLLDKEKYKIYFYDF